MHKEMKQTQVINIKDAPKDWNKNPDFVYIGRPPQGYRPKVALWFDSSKLPSYAMVAAGEYGCLGNPIPVGTMPNKETCIWCGNTFHPKGGTLSCYELYLGWRCQADPLFNEYLITLKGKTLVCFCKPAPCHGDVLSAWIDQL